MTARLALPLALAALAAVPPVPQDGQSPFRVALERAEGALAAGDVEGCRPLVQRALERDRKSMAAWDLRARLAEKAGDLDDRIYSRHVEYRLALAQGRPKEELATLRARLEELDPVARDLYGMKERFLAKLAPIAEKYEEEERPHSAIRVLKQILALDPENAEAQAAIERIAASPDPSLAGDAKPKDLFADVSDEWIAEFDAKHAEWSDRAKLERENYVTHTNAGYEVLVRSAEAMEQMNAFYRQFFRYGTEEHGGSVPRIDLHVFKARDDYLKLGIGPPVEWSGGHFTGGAVETYISSTFEDMVGTLFHEAAHQFVSLATNAVGWLNEGLASFFEGTRILPNGTVIMNMPANHRLFPLAARMEKGWMEHAQDGYDPNESSSMPEKAPTFRIVVENKYTWGPPWYAPTWGLVYFCYNYQDPVDGRYVYRAGFQEFIDKSGGRVGEGAIKNFEEVVLANPKPPLKGVDRDGAAEVALPKTVAELDDVWKAWILRLRDEQSGVLELTRPYAQWGRYAAANKDYVVAREHFEKGLVQNPGDYDLLLEFADLLSAHFEDTDRAAKLALEALYFLEQAPERDEKKIRDVERLLSKLDPRHETLAEVHDGMAAAARGVVERYAAAGYDTMVMDVAWRTGNDLKLEDMFAVYEEAVRRTKKTLAIWELAYNERDLEGWETGAGIFRADGTAIASSFEEFDEDRFDFRSLGLDRVTGGDFSIEVQVQAPKGEVNFCGIAFGRKDAANFHGLLLFPGKTTADGTADTGYVDLMTAHGSSMKTWLHIPVETAPAADGRSRSEVWHDLRVDVVGRNVDVWFDGEMIGTREFPSRDVLHGGFGLVTGPGDARYRDVRFLARDARDPASAIERTVRIEELEARTGGAVGGSYIGKVPPFPRVKRWVQGERTSWGEAGHVPQLVVFWSKVQNDLVRIDRWLQHLHESYADAGLQIVLVGSTHDDAAVESYLADHPMPGAIAVDHLEPDASGIGDSFELYFIRRFNLPRVLLLDLDHTVVWEGDPGFEVNVPPVEPYESFLDDPLKELLQRRKLVDLVAWRRQWSERGAELLAQGAFLELLPALRKAAEFDPRFAPEAGQAARSLRAVEAAVADLEGTGDSLASQGAEPALETLVEWATEGLGMELEGRTKRALSSFVRSDNVRDWRMTVNDCEKWAKKADPRKAPELLDDLEKRSGAIVEALVTDLRAAADVEDWEAFTEHAKGAEARPARWLALEYFRW